jgi:glucose dehydrogenase
VKRQTTARACLGLSVLLGAALAAQTAQSRQIEWPAYGADPASSRYSPADDITPQNVQRLTIAWQWEHGEKQLPDDDVARIAAYLSALD